METIQVTKDQKKFIDAMAAPMRKWVIDLIQKLQSQCSLIENLTESIQRQSKQYSELQESYNDLLTPSEWTKEDMMNAQVEVESAPLNQLRPILLQDNYIPKSQKKQTDVIRWLLGRLEKAEQENAILQEYRKTDSEIHSKMSTLETQVRELSIMTQILEAERNAISQALRIFASGGKIDPATEIR